MHRVLNWGVLAAGKENHCLHVPTAFVLVQMSGTCPRKTSAAAQLSPSLSLSQPFLFYIRQVHSPKVQL